MKIVRFHLVLALALAAACLPAGADVMYDSLNPGAGFTIKPGSNLTAIVQPFEVRWTGMANRFGIAAAQAADPNHVGFKVTLVDTNLTADLPGTPIADSWFLHPVSGPTLAYSYIDIAPIYLDHDKIYGFVVEPGDDQMYGAIASSLVGGPGWATSDNWVTKYRMGYPTCLRVYGTPVPEPDSMLAFLGFRADLPVDYPSAAYPLSASPKWRDHGDQPRK